MRLARPCLRLAVTLVAGAAISLLVSKAAPEPGRGGTGRPSLAPALAGAFVDWGAEGRESNMRVWEAWLNRPRGSVPALDYFGQKSWEEFRSYAWVPGFWAKANPARPMVWSIPLTVAGTDLSAIARGEHDADFRLAAGAIAAAHPSAIIRLGWEMNLKGSLWLAAGREADYIAAYRRVVGIFREQSNRFRYDWCPGWGPQESPADKAYPGDDVVDYIGLDVYDFRLTPGVEERWIKDYLDAPFGLKWQKSFARAHGKRMSLPEWGVGQAGDNPYFVEKMSEWFQANGSEIAYAVYFDVNGDWPTRIHSDQFPKSRDVFRTRFSRTGP